MGDTAAFVAIALTEGQHGDTVYRRYEKMHYIQVQKRNIDNVHFTLLKRPSESGCAFQRSKNACFAAFSQTTTVGIISMSPKAFFSCGPQSLRRTTTSEACRQAKVSLLM